MNGEVVSNDSLSFTFRGYAHPLPDPAEGPLKLPEWGCLTQLAIRRGIIQILTDHAGAYPLYRAFAHDGSLIIGSDAWQVSRLAGLRKLNPPACFDLLAYEYVPGLETLVEGLIEVPPATQLNYRFEAGQWHRTDQTLWQLERRRDGTANIDTAFDNLMAVMSPLQKVLDNDDTDQTIVINLSGGWDSRAILAGALHLDLSNIMACSYGNPDYSGIKFARQVANAANVPHNIFPFINGDFLKASFDQLCSIMPPTTRFNLADGALAMGQEFYGNSCGAICGHSGDGYSGLPAWAIKEKLETPQALSSRLNRTMRSSFSYSAYDRLLRTSGRTLLKDTERRLTATVRRIFIPGSGGYLRWKSVNRVRRAATVELRMLEHFTPIIYAPMLERHFIDFWSSVPDEQLLNQRLYRQMLATRLFQGKLASLADIPRESGGKLLPSPVNSILDHARTQTWRLLRRLAPAKSARLTAADPTAAWWHSDPALRLWAWKILAESPFVQEHFQMNQLHTLVSNPQEAEPSFARIGVWNLLTVAGVERVLHHHTQPQPQ